MFRQFVAAPFIGCLTREMDGLWQNHDAVAGARCNGVLPELLRPGIKITEVAPPLEHHHIPFIYPGGVEVEIARNDVRANGVGLQKSQCSLHDEQITNIAVHWDIDIVHRLTC